MTDKLNSTTNITGNQDNTNFEMVVAEQDTFEEDIPVIDQILNKYGYGPKTWLQIFLFFIYTAYEGFSLAYFSIILIPFTELYNLEGIEVQIISSIIFIGVGIGSFSSGSLSKSFSRIITLKIVFPILVLLFFLMGLIKNIYVFTIIRFFIGFITGIYLPISQSIFIEYLPVRLRGMTISLDWNGFNIASIIIICIMLIIMPNLEKQYLSKTFMILGGIHLVLYIFQIFLVKDSPRNLILKNKEDEGIEILEEYHGRPFTRETKEKILNQVKMGINKEVSSFKEMFNNKFLKTTILVAILWFLVSAITFGTLIVSSLTSKQIEIKEAKENSVINNRRILVDQLILQIINLPFSIIAGIFAETAILGRKFSIIIPSLLCIVLFFLCSILTSQFALIYGIALGVISIAFSLTGIYSNEFYPTQIRDYAMGFMYASTRLGGFLSQILFLLFDKIYIFLPYYVASGFSALIAILAWMIPYETYGNPLDKEYFEK